MWIMNLTLHTIWMGTNSF